MSTVNAVPGSVATPKVSVAMITYNHERYIAQAVESVLAQKTNFEFEIVIGEDVSKDGTRQVLLDLAKAHPGRLRLLLHEKNLGLLGKGNLAATFAQCRGEYMILLEGDDFWSSDTKLQTQADFLDAHPEVAGCFHQVYVLDSAGKRTECGYGFPEEISQGGVAEMLEYGFPHIMTLMFRRTVLPPLPPWFFELAMGDWSLCLLLAEQKPLAYLRGKLLSTYRLHSTSYWLTQPLLARTLQERAAMETFDRHLSGRNRAPVRRQINTRDFWLVAAYSEEGDLAKARASFWKAMFHWPRDRGVTRDWIMRYFFMSHAPRFLPWLRKIVRGTP